MGNVSGYGYDTDAEEKEKKGRKKERLQHAKVAVLNTKQCKHLFNRYSTAEIDRKYHVCAYGLPGTDADSCKGDSGGPLTFVAKHENKQKNISQISDPRIFALNGLVSFGK